VLALDESRAAKISETVYYKEAKNLDVKEKSVALSNGTIVIYDYLILATGGEVSSRKRNRSRWRAK
jgi:NADH dehydrogenase FAD-containing subunit